MEPSIFHSIVDNLHAQLTVSRQTNNSPNSHNKHVNKNKTTLNLQGATINLVGAPDNLELPQVDSKGLHAVFLESGQVYFGRLETIKPGMQFVKLKNIYYLQEDQNDGMMLIKLGNELHAPFDEMNINVSKIAFWEQLKDDGAVAQAIATFEKDNS
jgi:hypothetical protein